MTTRWERVWRGWMARNADELRAFSTGRLPGFVFRDSRPSSIPVFTFHDVEPDQFERQLVHLRDSDYRTVCADEIADRSGAVDGVALTFDDATWSFWAYAFPLLCKHGARAILFIVPGVVREGAGLRPTLEDTWEGRCSLEDVAQGGREDPFCTWAEIAAMHAAGCVDVQSHSLNHARVPVTSRVIDFVHREFDGYAGGFDIPLTTMDPDVEGRREPRPGMPIFESASRLSECLRFREDPELVRGTIALVEAEGPSFFARPDWRTVLQRVVDHVPPFERGKYEGPLDREVALRREVADSKLRIESRLPGHVVRHLAYPWHQDSELADRLAVEVGYTGVHGGAAFTECSEGPLLRIRRFPERYLLRLPGQGRMSLPGVLASGRRGQS